MASLFETWVFDLGASVYADFVKYSHTAKDMESHLSVLA